MEIKKVTNNILLANEEIQSPNQDQEAAEKVQGLFFGLQKFMQIENKKLRLEKRAQKESPFPETVAKTKKIFKTSIN